MWDTKPFHSLYLENNNELKVAIVRFLCQFAQLLEVCWPPRDTNDNLD